MKLQGLIDQRRLDLAVKARFFRHLLGGGDPDSERVYLWHIQTRTGGNEKRSWKICLDNYLTSARDLLVSMSRDGFDTQHPVILCPHGKLRGGAHRIACALVLGEPIHATEHEKPGRAAPWDEAFMHAKGISSSDLKRIQEDFKGLAEQVSNYHHA